MRECACCGGTGYVPDIKFCANERCGKPFRWQSRASGILDTSTDRGEVLFRFMRQGAGATRIQAAQICNQETVTRLRALAGLTLDTQTTTV